MKNKLKYLIGVSLKRKLKTKWFVIANIILALVIVGIANIDNIIHAFGGDFNQKTNIFVIDNTKQAYDKFYEYASNGFSLNEKDSKYTVNLYDKTKEEAITMLKENKDEKNSVVLIFDLDEENVIKVTMVSNDTSSLMDLTVINSAINNTKVYMAIVKYNISPEQIAGLTSNVSINREVLNESKNSQDENMGIIMSTVFPIIILPLFILTIFLVQMIGAEVNDEKTTRGMEIIISNVSPKVHLFSKCIAGNLFILIQSVLLFLYVLIGLFIRRSLGGGLSIPNEVTSMLSSILTSDFMSSLVLMIPLILILMILTFIGYSLLAGILASMTTNAEEFQQIQTPIMIISFIGYYLAMMAGMFKGALFIKILGFFPFISAILSPSLLVMGQFSIFDFIISILIMALTVFILIKYGLKVYKVGILNYSSGGMFKKMLKALKEN